MEQLERFIFDFLMAFDFLPTDDSLNLEEWLKETGRA